MKAGWTEVPFSEACLDVSSLAGKLAKSEWRDHGGIPVIDQGDSAIAGYTDTSALRFRGEVPVIVFGDHTRRFKFVDHPFVVGADGVKILKPSAQFDPRFLFWFFAGLDVRSAGYSRHFKFLKDTRVPLPPLDEQQRIARVLDLARAVRLLRARSVRSAAQLRLSILREMASVSEPMTLRVLDTLVAADDRINYGVVQPGEHTEGGVPLIRVGDLHGGRVRRERLNAVAPSVDAAYGRSRIVGNEILLSCVGSVGMVALTAPEDVGSNIVRAITRIPIESPPLRRYIAAYLETPVVQRYFTAELRTVAQPTLNIKQIRALEVPVPTDRWLAKFDRVAAVIDRQQRDQLAHLTTLDTLFASLQHRAFAGEL